MKLDIVMINENFHRLLIRPNINEEKAVYLAKRIFGLQVSKIKELESYDDRNFYMEGNFIRSSLRNTDPDRDVKVGLKNDENKFVFKVMNTRDTYYHGVLDATEDGINHLNNILGQQISLPTTLPTLDGKSKVLTDIEVSKNQLENQDTMLLSEAQNLAEGDSTFLSIETDQDGNIAYSMKHYVRLLNYIPGEQFPGEELSSDLVSQAGQLAARIVDALKNFTRPALVEKQSIWDMKNLMMLHSPEYLDAITDERKRAMIENSLDMYRTMVVPLFSKLPTQTIHSDINDGNLIVQKSNGKYKIIGLIDFGEMVYTNRVFEVSTCMLYLSLLKPDDCIRIAGIVLAGYLSETLLTQEEFDVLYYCVIGRVVMSLTIGNYQCKVLDPDNEFLLTTAENGWKVLDTLLAYKDDKQEILKIWLDSCSDKARTFYRT